MGKLAWALAAVAAASALCHGAPVAEEHALEVEELWLGSGAAESLAAAGRPEPRLKVQDDKLVLDGNTLQLRAGSIHYFRIVPEYWADRLDRVKAMGMNAITVYVAWNWHEGVRGTFDYTSADRDLARFLRLAHERDLLVLLRPGPYICGEWDFGGIPAWTLENGTYPIRTFAEPYLGFAAAFLNDLLPRIKPFLADNGGPVIMVQVENEFGSFGNVEANPADRQYLEYLVTLTRRHLGESVLLFTTDGPGNVKMGSLSGPSVISMVDGCTNPVGDAARQAALNPPGMSPFVCTETYTGWLTHWGEPFAQTKAVDRERLVRGVLALRNGTGGVSMYMAHGGTNFGFWSGANNPSEFGYVADITSYDYNAPIGEAGDEGVGSDKQSKFKVLRALFAEVGGVAPGALPSFPDVPRRRGFGGIPLTQYVSLLSNIDELATATRSGLAEPVAGETFGCWAGFIAYEVQLEKPLRKGSVIAIPSFHDRVHVFAGAVALGTLFRTDARKAINITVDATSLRETRLVFLVEHMGRINFSKEGMRDTRIGLLATPTIDGEAVRSAAGWTARCLSFERPGDLDRLPWRPLADRLGSEASAAVAPVLLRGSFEADAPADTFLAFGPDSGFGKGVAWVNKFNLGRYWATVSPQDALYVPGPRTRKGTNELVVLELERFGDAPQVQSSDRAVFTPQQDFIYSSEAQNPHGHK